MPWLWGWFWEWPWRLVRGLVDEWAVRLEEERAEGVCALERVGEWCISERWWERLRL